MNDLNRSGIYAIENIANGKVYVGSAKNLRTRKNNHFTDLRNQRHSSSHLQNAWNMYGADSFIFKVLEFVEVEQLEDVETKWIVDLKANDRDHGYNARVYVTHNRGLMHDEVTRKKISKNRTGKGKHKYFISKETRKLKQEAAKQLKVYRTAETEQKRLENLRKAIQGKPISDFHKKSISDKNRGSGNGASKLTEDDVIAIKKLLVEGELSQEKIGKMFGVSRRLVSFIKNGDRWGHL